MFFYEMSIYPLPFNADLSAQTLYQTKDNDILLYFLCTTRLSNLSFWSADMARRPLRILPVPGR